MCAKSPLGEWHVSHLPAPLEVFLFPDGRSESLRRLDSLFIVKRSWRTDQIQPLLPLASSPWRKLHFATNNFCPRLEAVESGCCPSAAIETNAKASVAEAIVIALALKSQCDAKFT